MSVIQINIVVLVTLFCFVHLVSCDPIARTDNVTKQFRYPSGVGRKPDRPRYGTPFKYTVPTDGCYKISATGAGGAWGPHYASGATAAGVFKLKSGLELTIVVGKYGSEGGGGGTFVFTVTKDKKRGDLYVVGGGAGYHNCYGGADDLKSWFSGQDSENVTDSENGHGADCDLDDRMNGWCSDSGAGWWSRGCGGGSCDWNGRTFEEGFFGATRGGGYGGGGSMGDGGYSGGSGQGGGGGGSFVNSTASHSYKHQNYPTTDRQHGTASVKSVDGNQC